jgi:hypothetical protein
MSLTQQDIWKIIDQAEVSTMLNKVDSYNDYIKILEKIFDCFSGLDFFCDDLEELIEKHFL